MYCGACAHDALLVNELRRLGHDAVVFPLYTPLRLDGDFGFPQTDVYLGGVNAYLKHASKLFRNLPSGLTRWLDNPKLLKAVSRFAISTKPSDLGPLTLTTLQGSHGPLADEFARLADAIALFEPDIVTLTNSMLSGIATILKVRTGVPVVCFLQGEDSFLEALPSPFKEQSIQQIKTNALSIDFFIAPCEDHLEKMRELLDIPAHLVGMVRMGIDFNAYHPLVESPQNRTFTVGYLSSILPGKGLDLLIEAVQKTDLSLVVAGKVLDSGFFKSLDRKAFDYRGELDLKEKEKFLKGIDLFCLPSRIRESRGVAPLEALACGTPCVLPDHGVFVEMASRTGAVALFQNGSVESLRSTLVRLRNVHQEYDLLQSKARKGVVEHYSVEQMALDTAELLGKVASQS